MTVADTDDRAVLARFVQQLAVVRGRVILASGREADYYVDMRAVTLSGSAAPVVGRVMLDLVRDWTFDAVGGLTMGADPVALAMVHARSAFGGDPLDAFVVRKEAKAHGMQRQIEGTDVAGRPVLVVEDTSTTGSSVLQAVEAVRSAGGIPVGVAVVVDRATGAREKIEALGLPYRYACNLADLGL